MTTEQIIFYIFSTVLIGSAVMVITSRNSVRAALFLVLAFFASACLWLMAQAEFLAVTLVLVYVGAVMVLFLFVVMMINLQLSNTQKGFIRYLPLGVSVAVIAVIQMLVVVNSDALDLGNQVVAKKSDYSNIAALGDVLYTDYLYHFELAAVVLLVAIIAAISLTFRGRRQGTKGQRPGKQVMVKRDDRVRLVNVNPTDPSKVATE